MTTKLSTRNGISNKIIIKTPDIDYVPHPGGIGIVFFYKMQSHGGAIAQIDGVTGEKDSYASLLQRSVRTAIKMRSLGVTSNDIVTICSINHLNCCVPFFAASFLGAKIANLDPTLSLTDTCFLLQQVCPKLVFVGEEAVDLISSALSQTKLQTKMVVFGRSSKYIQFSSFLFPSVAETYFEPVKVFSNKDTAAIFFSSGTTGLPKGICLSHYGILTAAHLASNMGLSTKVILGYASMYWITSIMYITCSILNKSCRIICPQYDPKTIWHIIRKHQVDCILLAPIQAIYLSKLGRPIDADTSSLKQFLIGGGCVSKELLEQLRKMLPEAYVFTVYGQTETFVTSCFNLNRSDDLRCIQEKLDSSGKIVDGYTYKVVDTETEETLGPNQKGELRLKAKHLMTGYYNMDSSDAWDDEGFLKTGDVVYYDEEFCMYIVDRVKDMLKYQMWHIAPAFLEGILLTHPAVQAAVVVGLPHAVDGDHPMAAVVLKESYIGKITTNELQRFVDERVDERKKLRGGIKIVDKIPFTASGKLKRTYIRDLALKGKL